MRAHCSRPHGCPSLALSAAVVVGLLAASARPALAAAPAAEPKAPTAAAPTTAPATAPATEGGAAAPTTTATDEATLCGEASEAGPDDASPPPPATIAEALGRQPAKVKCLDESLIDEFGRSRARKGVQPRDFRKAPRLALTFSGGAYAGDLVSTNWQAGGRVGFWFTEHFGIDGQFWLMPVDLRIERAATGFTGEDRFPDSGASRLAYVFHGHLLWSPIHTKLRTGRDKVVHGDFVFYGGAGRTIHHTAQGASFDLGAAFMIFPARFFSLRLDLQDHILGQEAIGSTRTTNNLVVSASMEFWIPFHGKRAERRREQRRQAEAEAAISDELGGAP